MRNIFIAFFLLAGIPFLTHAQDSSSRQYWLSLQGGLGVGMYREMGASPITNIGFEVLPGVSLKTESDLWRSEWYVGGSAGGYGYRLRLSSLQSYGAQPIAKVTLWHKLKPLGPVDLWLGGSVEDVFDVRYQSSLSNSATSFGNWMRVNGLIRGEYALNQWDFYALMELNPLALLLRPGYAYMDNFDQDIANPIGNTFDQYHWYFAPLTGVNTEIGVRLHLRHVNRLGLSYKWRYLTSRITADGVAAPHRFEYAQHGIGLTLDFGL